MALSQPAGKWDAPVAVLVDDQTGSSGEATMLAFRGLERSRSFGSPPPATRPLTPSSISRTAACF
nr:S41 family peptidase [Corynebacterium aquatimens]